MTFALTSRGSLRRARRRGGALETRPLGVPGVIGGKMRRGGESFRAFRELLDAKEDRHEVDVGEGEEIVDEMAAAGDRLVEDADLLAQGRHHGLDRLSIRLSVGAL